MTVTRIRSRGQEAIHRFYTEYVSRYADDPMRFCQEALNFEPTFQQTELIEGIRENKRCVCRAGHGVGKTKATSSIILWWITTRPFSRVLATSPNISILHKVLWPELAAGFYELCQKFPPMPSLFGITRTTFYQVQHAQRWFAVARTSGKGRSQGIAGQHAEHFLCVVEEASAVEEEVFEVLDGALTGGPENKLIMVGNPTQNHGRFYDAFHSKSDGYLNLHWNGEESPLVNEDMIKLFQEEYGVGSREYDVRVKGEFPKKISGMLLGHSEISAMETNVVEHLTPPMKIISVDVAGSGRDSSVIMLLRVSGDGSERRVEIEEIREYQIGVDTMQLAAEVAFLFRQERCQLIVDSVGVGQGVSDYMTQSEIEHHACNWGRPSWFADRFANQRAEAFHWMRECVVRKEISCAKNPKLFNQMSNLPYGYNERGKLQMWSKDRLVAKGIKSPDLADSLAMSFLVAYEPPPDMRNMVQPHQSQTPQPQAQTEESVTFGAAVPSTLLPPSPSQPSTQDGGDSFNDFLRTDW